MLKVAEGPIDMKTAASGPGLRDDVGRYSAKMSSRRALLEHDCHLFVPTDGFRLSSRGLVQVDLYRVSCPLVLASVESQSGSLVLHRLSH